MNPFTPNFGQIPVRIAGRSREISDILYALDDNLGSPSRTSLFIGARGTGKTALLSYLSAESQALGWISADVSCLPGMEEEILQQAARHAAELLPADQKAHVTGISVGSLFSVDWEQETEHVKTWRTRITELMDELDKYSVGLLITIDEVDPKLDEMIRVASTYQLLIRENRKVALLMAGLPSTIYALLNDKAVSFLRRAAQYTLEPIEDYEVKETLKQTIEEAGKEITDGALDMAVKAIQGFPYMLQLVGYRSWEAAGADTEIDEEAVRSGIAIAEKDLEQRVIRSTIKELSKGDMQFLYAMIQDEGTSKISDIEQRLGKSHSYTSLYRSRLIEAGVLQPQGRGIISFAIPGLKKYLTEQL